LGNACCVGHCEEPPPPVIESYMVDIGELILCFKKEIIGKGIYYSILY
jgi:hypothetical protein